MEAGTSARRQGCGARGVLAVVVAGLPSHLGVLPHSEELAVKGGLVPVRRRHGVNAEALPAEAGGGAGVAGCGRVWPRRGRVWTRRRRRRRCHRRWPEATLRGGGVAGGSGGAAACVCVLERESRSAIQRALVMAPCATSSSVSTDASIFCQRSKRSCAATRIIGQTSGAAQPPSSWD